MVRFGEVVVFLFGGCVIGVWLVDFYFKVIEVMGVEIMFEEGYVYVSVFRGLYGVYYEFLFVLVGVIENVLMVVSFVSGEIILENVVCEFEIIDLVECFIKMGVDIDGFGILILWIKGKVKFFGVKYCVMFDRIEMGIYVIVFVIIVGDVMFKEIWLDLIFVFIFVLEELGVLIVSDVLSVCIF